MRNLLLAAMLLVTVPSLGWSLPPQAQDTIGVVRNSAGNATVIRGEQVFQAVAGTKLHEGDTLSTGPDGAIGVILRDNSLLSLGPVSRLVVVRFLFAPAEEKIGLLARLSRGTMAYISGLIGKLAPESVRFETPTASIGIRGTYFAVKVEEPTS